MNSEEEIPTQIRRTPEQIQQLVAAFRRSGQTIGQFAQQQGVAISTVGRWLRRHRQSKVPRLIEVKRAPNLDSSSRMATLRLSGELVLELEQGFKAEPIARLVQLLEGR
jgi:transposase-like protein